MSLKTWLKMWLKPKQTSESLSLQAYLYVNIPYNRNAKPTTTLILAYDRPVTKDGCPGRDGYLYKDEFQMCLEYYTHHPNTGWIDMTEIRGGPGSACYSTSKTPNKFLVKKDDFNDLSIGIKEDNPSEIFMILKKYICLDTIMSL